MTGMTTEPKIPADRPARRRPWWRILPRRRASEEERLERYLSPLLQALPGHAPPPGLLARIEQEIAAGGEEVVPVVSRATRGRRPVRWVAPFALGLASGIGATAALVLVTDVPWLERAPDPVQIASMSGASGTAILRLQRAGGYRYLLVDYRSAVPTGDGALELWSIPAGGGGPRSLGVLAPKTPLTVVPISRLPEEGDIFALSLEPPGGSPEAGPTGPVVMNTFFRADD